MTPPCFFGDQHAHVVPPIAAGLHSRIGPLRGIPIPEQPGHQSLVVTCHGGLLTLVVLGDATCGSCREPGPSGPSWVRRSRPCPLSGANGGKAGSSPRSAP